MNILAQLWRNCFSSSAVDSCAQNSARGKGNGGDSIKKVKRLAKEHICRAHRQRQYCDEGQEKGRQGGWSWAKGMEIADIYNSVNIS